MLYFPDADKFDMTTREGRCWYLARCDFEPLNFLIEHTHETINLTLESLGKTGIANDKIGNVALASTYFELQGIFSARVAPLSYQSILLIMFSLFEEAMKTWCRCIETDNKCQSFIDFCKENKKDEITNSVDYIEKFSETKGIKHYSAWDYLHAIRIARNMIVHSGGRVEEKYRDFLKTNDIGMYDENFAVYIDLETTKKMYDSILNLIDYSFSLNGVGKT